MGDDQLMHVIAELNGLIGDTADGPVRSLMVEAREKLHAAVRQNERQKQRVADLYQPVDFRPGGEGWDQHRDPISGRDNPETWRQDPLTGEWH